MTISIYLFVIMRQTTTTTTGKNKLLFHCSW
jgi:hypothetical protein